MSAGCRFGGSAVLRGGDWSGVVGLWSWPGYLAWGGEMRWNWAGLGECGSYCRGLVSGRGTGHWTASSPAFDIFLMFPNFVGS